MTNEEFVAEINSKCPNLTAKLNERGLVIQCKNDKSAVLLYYYPHLHNKAFGISRDKNGVVRYISRNCKQQLIDKLKERIGYKKINAKEFVNYE